MFLAISVVPDHLDDDLTQMTMNIVDHQEDIVHVVREVVAIGIEAPLVVVTMRMIVEEDIDLHQELVDPLMITRHPVAGSRIHIVETTHQIHT